MMQRQWQGTGHQVQVPGEVDRIPPYDPRSGDHLWIVNTSYRVDPARMADPTDGPALLDQENLVLIVGPACFYCEQVYEPRLLRRRCPGDPK